MAASSDKLKKYKSLYSSTLSTGIGTGTTDTITPASVTGLPTDTAITLTFDRVNSGGEATPTKMERIKGVISGGNLTSYVRAIDGSTEQAHTAGAVIEMIWNAADWNDLVDWGLVEHNQDGTHKGALVTTLKATGAEVNTGTEDAKIVTPKAIGDSNVAFISDIPVKATGAEIDAGTDDAKFATSKAIADSFLGSIMGTDGIAKFHYVGDGSTINTASTSFVDMTGMTKTITPQSTKSKFLIFFICEMSMNTGNSFAEILINKDGVGIGSSFPRIVHSNNLSTGGFGQHIIGAVFNSPATASNITYKLQWKVGANTAYSRIKHLFIIEFKN
jgi:hypothetical protein